MRKVTAILAGFAALALAAAAQAEAPVVRVESGELVGEATEHANIFRAVPYAAAPVGKLRWAAPEPAPAWQGRRDASQIGPSCPQKMNADGTPNLGAANGPTSEDCLQVNVFAPPAAKAAPVMVWLHGGGFSTGAGWVYDGRNFARDGVVVVTVNYRLGTLGFFAHPALTAAAGAKAPLGNYGVMDQIAALQWVKRNIAAFGGDPDNVTVFGESAGGASVAILLSTPAAKGLFNKAIIQSGLVWQPPGSLPEAEARGTALAGKLGAADLAALRALPPEAIVEAAPDAGPFADGRLLLRTPTEALAQGLEIDVPLIIGWNSGEDSLLGFKLPDPAAVVARYPLARDPAYAADAAMGDDRLARILFTESMFGAAARWGAAQAADGAPAWLYHFSYVGGRFRPYLTTAAHAAEIQYAWEYWGRRTPMSVVTDEDRRMATLMHGCWVAFAKTGAPDCGVPWPRYDPAKDVLLEFGADTGLRTHFRKAPLDAQEKAQLPRLGVEVR